MTRWFRLAVAMFCALTLLTPVAAFGSDDKPSGSGSSGSGSSGSGSGSDSGGRGRGGDDDDRGDHPDDTSPSVPTTPIPTPVAGAPSSPSPPSTTPSATTSTGATTQPSSTSSRERRTRCGARGWATLRVQDKGSALRVRFSIDPRPSSTWTVVVLHERRIEWRGAARRGEFDRSVKDYPGADAIAVRADDGRGTVCSVELVTPG